MQAGLVRDLSTRGPEWEVTVRLTRIWENKGRDNKMYELGLLFIDQQGNMIEGCLPENRVIQFGDRLKEGLVYTIDRFMVSAARNKYRTVEHAYRIRITQQTRLTALDPAPPNFPLYAYDSKPFDVLAKHVGHVTTLSDVIGVVYKLTDVIPSKTNHDPRRQVFLKNDRPAVVTLWGKHAETFNAEGLYEASLESNVPILFMGMTVDCFSGMLAFKSTSLSRWLIDPPVPEAAALRESLQGERYTIEWSGHEAVAGEPTETTLCALAAQETSNIVRKKYNLNIRITAVNNPHDWWFYACKSCWKKMVPTGAIRKCPDCGGTDDEQRYKLSISAKDIQPADNNDRVIGVFVFFGKHGTALIGKEAALLAAQTRGRTDFVPSAIASIVGREFAVTAEVKQDTYDAEPGYIILKASKVELIAPSAPNELRSDCSDLLADKETNTIPAASTDVQEHSEKQESLQITPAKDIVNSADDETEEDISNVSHGKKRRGIASDGKTSKKSSSVDNRKASKELFPRNQNN